MGSYTVTNVVDDINLFLSIRHGLTAMCQTREGANETAMKCLEYVPENDPLEMIMGQRVRNSDMLRLTVLTEAEEIVAFIPFEPKIASGGESGDDLANTTFDIQVVDMPMVDD